MRMITSSSSRDKHRNEECGYSFLKQIILFFTFRVSLNCYRSFQYSMRLIVYQFKVFPLKILDILESLEFFLDLQLRERKRFTRKLLGNLLLMIWIDMSISKRMNKGSRSIACYFCNHHEQGWVWSNVKRHTKKYIRASLIQLEV